MKYQSIDSFSLTAEAAMIASHDQDMQTRGPSIAFFALKRASDIAFSLLLLPVFLVAVVVLSVVNPFYNRGPLFYIQVRMGEGTRAFRAIKFRSMTQAPKVVRGAQDPLEIDRITPFGKFLRKSRVDELPQILNVLKDDMSLIGPRPDYFGHAKQYLRSVPGYRARHDVKPGISGFAQTEVGYAENLDAVAEKVAADLFYIRNRRVMFEAWIFWRTILTVFGRKGS